MKKQNKWAYERGEGRFKHCWSNPYPGFVPSQKGAIGKCPSTINDQVAQSLLNEGVPFFEYDEDEYPSRIYSVYQGVIYEAVPTNPGVSYHGFPWRGRLPKKIISLLEVKAKATGHDTEFKRWLKSNTK